MTQPKQHKGLSPSSMALFTSCQKKFYFKKIAKIPIDADTEADTTAFRIGRCFHRILELRMHELSGLMYSEVVTSAVQHELDPEEVAPMIFAMLCSYKSMHEKAELKALACEIEIETEDFFGIVDTILVDLNLTWSIVDMKTSAAYSPLMLPTLIRHPQLNLYAKHADFLAAKLNLDPRKFQGCRLRVTTKSKLVRKATETKEDFITRLRKSIKSYDIVLPKEKMASEEIYKIHASINKYIQQNTVAEAYPPNYQNCLAYFKNCEYFSRCFSGKLFTSELDLQIIESD